MNGKITVVDKSGKIIDDEKSYDQEALEDLYEQIAGSADASVTCKIYRQRVGLKGDEKCFEYAPSDYTFSQMEDKVSSEYGAGAYRIKIYAGNKLRCNQPFYIAERLNNDKNLGAINPALQMLSEQNRQLSERLNNALETKRTPFNFESVLVHAPAVITSIASIIALIPKQQTLGPLEMITLLKELKEIMPDNSTQKDDSFFGSVTKALETFVPPIIKASEQNSAHKMAMALNQKQLTIDSQKKQAEQQIENNQDEKLEKLKMILSICVVGARVESAPEIYANLISDQLDDNEAMELLEYSQRPDFFLILSSVNAETINHKQWFEKMFNDFQLLFVDEPEQDQTTQNNNNQVNNNNNLTHEPEPSTLKPTVKKTRQQRKNE